jgi:hypothetical protein
MTKLRAGISLAAHWSALGIRRAHLDGGASDSLLIVPVGSIIRKNKQRGTTNQANEQAQSKGGKK